MIKKEGCSYKNNSLFSVSHRNVLPSVFLLISVFVRGSCNGVFARFRMRIKCELRRGVSHQTSRADQPPPPRPRSQPKMPQHFIIFVIVYPNKLFLKHFQGRGEQKVYTSFFVYCLKNVSVITKVTEIPCFSILRG